jgi:hypothetical protein
MVASPRYAENIITILTEAADANRQTPGRQGTLLVLGPELAGELMVTGDLHGHRRNFNLIRRIAALDEHPRRHLLLQEACHGGPTYSHARGCMSHTMIEDIARLKVKYPGRVHFMLGNHELAEMSDYPIQKNRQLLNLMFQTGLEHMYGAETQRVRQAMNAFFRTCLLGVRLQCGVFISHSVPERTDVQGFDKTIFARELDPADFEEPHAVFRLVWGRDYRPENARTFAELMGAKVLINGHEPCPDGFAVPNPSQILLDCCGDKACYVILPTDHELSQAEIVGQIRPLA